MRRQSALECITLLAGRLRRGKLTAHGSSVAVWERLGDENFDPAVLPAPAELVRARAGLENVLAKLQAGDEVRLGDLFRPPCLEAWAAILPGFTLNCLSLSRRLRAPPKSKFL